MWYVRTIAVLVLGIVTTLGVAMGCAILSPRTYVHWAFWGPKVIERRDKDGAMQPFSVTELWESFGRRERELQWGHWIEAGWPWFALEGDVSPTIANGLTTSLPPVSMAELIVPARTLLGLPREPRLVPVHPLWSGFARDVVFYSAIWFVLCIGRDSLRVHRRRVRGRCPCCNYDLRGLTQDATCCPECGAARNSS
jgi:hypothetical protein